MWRGRGAAQKTNEMGGAVEILTRRQNPAWDDSWWELRKSGEEEEDDVNKMHGHVVERDERGGRKDVTNTIPLRLSSPTSREFTRSYLPNPLPWPPVTRQRKLHA